MRRCDVFLLIAVLAMTVIIGLIAVDLASAQCPGGRCPAPSIDYRYRQRERIKIETPTPAWRYVEPVEHRQAVVRIYCETAEGRNIGSGVLVRWGKRIVVLTARHVIKGAKRIIIGTHSGRKVKVRVLKVDATWDCAVLLPEEPLGDVFAAEMEMGPAAMLSAGARLESVGYGSDGKLAANSGIFKGYRRSSAAMQGPDDWMVISGPARQGDSGGPIFNEYGRVVGVLWGTDNETVVGVQAGRLHTLLDEAIAAVDYEQMQLFERTPTPPRAGPMTPIEADQAARAQRAPVLPWRGGAEARDGELDKRLGSLLFALEQERQARIAGQRPNIDVQVGPPPKTEVKPDEENNHAPLLAALAVLGGVFGGFVLYFAAGKQD